MRQIGVVKEIFCYPVKSMLGSSLSHCTIAEHGLPGDRRYALFGADKYKPLSAKRVPELFRFSARFDSAKQERDAVTIVFPDGTSISAASDKLDGRLSEQLKSSVSFADFETQEIGDRRRPGGFFDDAPLHLITTSTLNCFRQMQDSDFDVRRFRPNFLIDTGDQIDFVETSWLGQKLQIGAAVLEVNAHCSRCVMTTLAQANLLADTNILKTVALKNQDNAGVYAKVISGGAVVVGDQVALFD